MLTVKETIENSNKLQRVLKKSKRKRRTKWEKNFNYCEMSKKARESELNKEYPLEKIQKGVKRFWVLWVLMRVRLMLSGVRIKPLNTFTNSDIKRPVIFVPTHIGKFDIEIVYSCIKQHALLLSGTEDRMHGSMDGFFLENNGVNYVDRSDKKDRANALKKMEMDLENGFNLLWYIEGTWNLSANKLVYDISYSAIKLALKCNVDIIPIGLNQIGKTVYIKFGLPFTPDEHKSLEESALDLRDILATLKWDIYEYASKTHRNGSIKRTSIEADYWENYIIERVKEWPMTDLIEELNYVYHPKDEAHAFFEEYCSKYKNNWKT